MEIKSVLYFSALHQSFQEDIVYVHNNFNIKFEKNDKKVFKSLYIMPV